MPSVSSRRSRRRLVNEINVVPYIDVMLVLLVIFMVTAPLIPTGLINVPSAGKASPALPESGYVEVSITKSGTMKVAPRSLPGKKGEREVSGRQALIDEVRAQTGGDNKVPVVIRADESVIYKTVIETFSELKGSGISSVGFIVRPVN